MKITEPNQGLPNGVRIWTLCALFFAGCLAPAASYAKEPPKNIDPAALRSLAQDFVSRIGGKLKTYNADSAGSATGNQLSIVPDGELLLLRPKSEKFIMDAEIGAIKEKGTLYLSLNDIITLLELSIDYDPARGTGSGWFLREDWLIRFDFNKKEVVSRGETYPIADHDLYKDGDDIYISQDAAKKWLAIDTVPDLAQQYIEIKTPYPYPALARNYRDRNINNRRERNISTLPRADEEDRMFDINVVETQQSMRVRKGPDRPTTTLHQNTTSAAGQILNHNAYGIASWDSDNNLTNFRGRLSKESEDAELLGPLKARAYTLGDTELPQLPLTGTVTQELGVRVNNNPLRNADFQRTTISGDSLPGWDVELYREGFLVDRIRVEDDARYEFPDIDLYAGDNLFEVFFYGPQGEIRKDSFNIPVNEEFLNTQDNTYDFSLSFNDAQTYSKLPSEDEDADTPHFVARYNKLIGNTLAYAGIRARQEDGEQKAYLGTGFTNVWNGFVFDGNAAMDEKSNKALQLTTRKNIDDWRLSLTGNVQDDEFGAESDTLGVLGVLGSANKNFRTPFDTRINFNTSGEYKELADESKVSIGRMGLSHQMGRFTLSDTASYTKRELGGTSLQDDPEDRIDNMLAARMTFGKFYTSAGVNYNVKPDAQVDSYFGQLSYYPTNRISSDLYVEHDPVEKHSEARLNVNYRHDKFRVTPFIDVDSDSEIQTGVRLSTTFVDQPGSKLPLMTGERIMGRGLVSSFVFYDKNGNNVFDGNDEVLPDVEVESVNIARRAPTNEQGYSLIKDLPENYLTDIRVDKNTLPDPYMISGFEGASVYPKAGQMTNLVFPIHMGGEIDGTVAVTNGETEDPVAGMPLNLYPIDGKSSDSITVRTAADGYYFFGSVPPGDYLMAPDATVAGRYHAGGAAPSFIKIGYEGTVLSGRNMMLEKGRTQVPVEMKPYQGPEYDKPFFALQVGTTAKSRLALALEKLIAGRTADMQKDLSPFPMAGNDSLKYLPGKGLMDHYDRCQAMNDSHIPCRVLLYIPAKKDTKIQTARKE